MPKFCQTKINQLFVIACNERSGCTVCPTITRALVITLRIIARTNEVGQSGTHNLSAVTCPNKDLKRWQLFVCNNIVCFLKRSLMQGTKTFWKICSCLLVRRIGEPWLMTVAAETLQVCWSLFGSIVLNREFFLHFLYTLILRITSHFILVWIFFLHSENSIKHVFIGVKDFRFKWKNFGWKNIENVLFAIGNSCYSVPHWFSVCFFEEARPINSLLWLVVKSHSLCAKLLQAACRQVLVNC